MEGLQGVFDAPQKLVTGTAVLCEELYASSKIEF